MEDQWATGDRPSGRDDLRVVSQEVNRRNARPSGGMPESLPSSPLPQTYASQMGIAEANPFAIMKAMGQAAIKTTMIHVSLRKSQIREQVRSTCSLPQIKKIIKVFLPPAISQARIFINQPR